MAKLNARERKALPKSDFGVPSKAPGSGSYPMPDKNHAQNAKARAAQSKSMKPGKTIGAPAIGSALPPPKPAGTVSSNPLAPWLHAPRGSKEHTAMMKKRGK